MSGPTLALTAPSLLLLLLTASTWAGRDAPPPKNCKKVHCPTPLCADPVTPPGQCCPSCAHSECKFGGCVQYEPKTSFTPVRWLPDPCTICHCRDGQTVCGAIGCPGFPGPDPCFGRPLLPVGSTPSVCCPRCDFGVPETACRAVPSTRKTFSIQHGTSTCGGQIIQHKCDKVGYRKNGKIFRCQPVMGNRYVSVLGCGPFTRVAHEDVRYCRAVRDDSLTGAEGCDLIVRPTLPQGVPGKA